MDSAPPVVLDSGTGIVKAGFAGDRLPRVLFPCVVGRQSKRRPSSLKQDVRGQQGPGHVVGCDALDMAQDFDLSYPMSQGVVKSWKDIQLVWDHTWQQLGIQPSEHKVLLTDPALSPVANKQTTLEMMLEHYGFQAAGMQVQAVLTLYAHGLESGVVLDSGDGVSHAVAVVQGYAMSHLTRRLDVAGRHITEYLMELLLRRGAALHREQDLPWVQRIKECACYVSRDWDREHRLYKETTCMDQSYTLPDGRIIKVGVERFHAPEALFRPSLLDHEKPGIAQMVFDTINECDLDNRRELYDHIVISGGNTMFPGLPARLEQDVSKLYLQHVLQNMVFKGASIFASLTQHSPDSWVTLKDWREEGPQRCMQRLGLLAV